MTDLLMHYDWAIEQFWTNINSSKDPHHTMHIIQNTFCVKSSPYQIIGGLKNRFIATNSYTKECLISNNILTYFFCVLPKLAF